ncbi:MAG: hypothetical protein ACK53L_34295, partial [Pirellulaceae bacterium]
NKDLPSSRLDWSVVPGVPRYRMRLTTVLTLAHAEKSLATGFRWADGGDSPSVQHRMVEAGMG